MFSLLEVETLEIALKTPGHQKVEINPADVKRPGFLFKSSVLLDTVVELRMQFYRNIF